MLMAVGRRGSRYGSQRAGAGCGGRSGRFSACSEPSVVAGDARNGHQSGDPLTSHSPVCLVGSVVEFGDRFWVSP